MDRRNFIKNIAAAGVVVTIAPFAQSVSESKRVLFRTVEIDVFDHATDCQTGEYTRWRHIEWQDLQAGDHFRLREPDGSLVDKGTPHEISIARGPARSITIQDGVTWTVDCDSVLGVVA